MCHASGNEDAGAAEEGDPMSPQEPPSEQAQDDDKLTDDEILASASPTSESEQARRAQFVEKYFQSKYDPMYHGKWVDIQGAEMKMPDYDFSEYEWMSRVSTDIGWPMFWECVPPTPAEHT